IQFPETGNNGVTTFFSNSKCFHAHESQSERLICSQAVSQVKIYTGEAESRYWQPWQIYIQFMNQPMIFLPKLG
ncbi:hypothetical protein BLOT_003100, partial [Blomia tropicalis]